MQVCGGSQSFNAVNQMRVLGRWMRMIGHRPIRSSKTGTHPRGRCSVVVIVAVIETW